MLSRLKTRIQSLTVLLRDRWTRLGRRRQVAVGIVGALVVAGGVSAAVVLGLSGGGPPTCDKPLCTEVLGPVGDAVQPMAPVRIRLAGDLNRKAAVEALQISNQPAGNKRFEGDVLTFRPEWPGFARGVSYDVALALPASALPVGAEPVDMSFRFTTDGKLQVSSVFPEDGTQEVALDAGIMVQFNRSVAPLTVIDERGPQGIIEFDPPVAGEGRWLNTSLYTFTPAAAGWAPAAHYTATVKAGLANQLGAQLEKDYVFSFTTVSPEVLIFFPLDNTKFVGPEEEIKVGFNQPVDRPSAEAAFSLVPQGTTNPVAGSFEWLDDRTFVFHQAQPLALSTTFGATVRAGVRARDAAAATAEDVRWSFTSIGLPHVASTDPQNGNQQAQRNGVRITFTNPMDQKSVEDHIVITPKPDSDPYMSWETTGLNLYVGFEMQASTAYRITLSTDAKDRYGQPLVDPLDLSFVTDRMQPGFSIFRSSRSGTFNVYLDPTIFVSSWNLERVDFELYRIDRNGLIATERQSYGSYSPPPTGLIRKWSEAIQNPPLDQPMLTSTQLAEAGSKLPEGIYFLRVSAPGASGHDEMALVVSSVNVASKWTRDDLLTWLVDMSTGEPIAGLPFQVLDSAANVVASGTTDADGLAHIKVPEPPNGEYWSGYYLSAEQGGRTILSGTAWNDGINPWNFSSDMSFEFTPPDLVGYLYTDRPIYRPGETVYLKGVVRGDDDARYSIPSGPTPALTIRDEQGRMVSSQSVGLSDMGTFNTDLALSPEASTGMYYASLTQGQPSPDVYLPDVAYVSFRVAEFRKPEFEVNVTTDKDSYVNGETIRANIAADLFFGAPLANADVKWQITAQPFSFHHDDYPGYSFSDYQQDYQYEDYGPRYTPQQYLRGEGTGKTDAQGRFSFSAPANVSSDPLSQTFTVEATVTDQNAQSVAEFTAVEVHKGRFYVGLKPESYVAFAGQETKVSLVSIDPDGKPVANVPVKASIYERKWRTIRQRDPDGQQRYHSEPEDTLQETMDARTGADGTGEFAFTPAKSGEYYVVVETKDDAGNVIKASDFVWASSAEYASWSVGNDDVIKLVADKDEYSPGDTAKILVAAPFEASRGLVTQERGRLIDYGLHDFQTNSDILEVPITADHIPNVYVGVTLFKPPTADNPMPQVKFGLVELKVSTDQKELRISLQPDKDKLQPRDTVKYEIATTDSEGHGVPAELSLAMVDLSVLSLQDEFAQPALQAFWDRRALGVLTGSSFAVSIDRANELAISRQAGGGKGGGGGAGDQTRTFFPNTAYWEPSLRTDGDGKATVEVKLPDTLTTWRLTARGVTTDTKAGEARNDVVTSKELIVRPAVPRFLVADDHAFLGAIVHNFSEARVDVDVSLTADGLDVEGSGTQSVTIAAGEDALVRWETTAPPGRDSVDLTFKAEGGGRSDSVGLTLPLYGFVTPETVGTAGEVTDEASEAIDVPYYVRPDAGELTVSVSPSLAAGVNTAIDYLKEYPWDSTEVTVSRFVSVLALQRATDQLGLSDLSAPGTDAKALVQRSVQRLYNFQHQDGGWGWWFGDDSDPAITAYVVTGLAEAKRAGFSVDQYVDDRAAEYLTVELDKSRDVLMPELDLSAYILYALALDGRGDLGRSFAMAERRANLSNTAKAWSALAIKLSGGSEKDPRLTSLLSDLQAAAIPSATGNHWEETQYNPDIFGDSTQTTAQVLQALTEFQPEHPLVNGTLRWLMVARKEGHWESSHDTAIALLAITDFMLVRKDAQEAFDYRVQLNGDAKLEGTAEAGKVNQEDKTVIDMKDLLKDTVNELKLTRQPSDAAGRLYYTAHLRYFTPAENIDAANYGIGVSHQYFRADVNPETPVTEVQLGDTVMVKVTLTAPSDLNFLVLEDYLPAGLEPIDTSLKTTSGEIQRRLYEEERKAYQIRKRYNPFGHTDIRDNRVALFARFVPKGVYEYTYFAQAMTPGEFKLPPATAYEQYFPEVWGRSDGGTFVVQEEAGASRSRPLEPPQVSIMGLAPPNAAPPSREVPARLPCFAAPLSSWMNPRECAIRPKKAVEVGGT